MATLAREAVERALPFHLQAALPELCRIHGVARDRWPDHRVLEVFLVTTAATVLRDRGYRRGMARTVALEVACAELGISYAAVRKRIQRAGKAYIEAGGSGDVLSREPVLGDLRFKGPEARRHFDTFEEAASE